MILFVFISAGDPDWLEKLSHEEKQYEANINIRNGIKLFQEGESEKSIEEFKKALDIKPDIPEALVNLGVVYKQLENYDEAIELLIKALAQNPKDSSNIYSNLVDIYSKIGDSEQSELYFYKSLETNSHDIDKLMKKGSFFLNRKEWEKSIDAFKTSLERRNKIETYYTDMLIMALKRYEENESVKNDIHVLLSKEIEEKDLEVYVSELFLRMLHKDRGYAVNLNKLGYAVARTGEFREAEKYFRKALQIWPYYPDANDNLKYIQEKLSPTPDSANQKSDLPEFQGG